MVSYLIDRSGLAIILCCILFHFPFLVNAQKKELPASKLVFISDTQAPTWVENIFLKSNRNEVATEILLNGVLEQNPSGIFFLGDLVNLGYKNDRWKLIDTCLYKIRATGICAYACLGNHELMGRAVQGEKNFKTRFPDQVNDGFMLNQDSIAVILLNSNFSKMTKVQLVKQDEWYNRILNELDTAKNVKTIIVCCHHSPYSHSRLVGSSIRVQEKFVKPYIKSKKTSLFITGHAHLFERFNVQGKDFLVIGGGGGLHHPMKKSISGPKDLSPEYKPMYHYLTVTLYSEYLTITSYRLKEDFSGIEEGLTFNVPLKH